MTPYKIDIEFRRSRLDCFLLKSGQYQGFGTSATSSQDDHGSVEQRKDFNQIGTAVFLDKVN